MKKYIILLLTLLPLAAFAQGNITVSGKVVSATDNTPVIGATITVKGANQGVVTNISGDYVLSNVSPGAVIEASMLGYKTETAEVGGRTRIDFTLTESSEMLDDIVVIGYGAVRKSDLTSSISTVKGAELAAQSTGNALYALQGKTSGIQITGSGGPGDSPRVIIRGISTVNKIDPLFVVDGIPLGGNINLINPNDIESIDVLKDASAAAIYGTRGSNGVILITTKKGKSGEVKFQVNSTIGFQTLQKPDIAGASIYEKVFKARHENDENTAPWNVKDNISNSEGTDWWDQTINKIALQQDHGVSFQGGSDKVVYSGSIGYYRQESQYDYGYWDRLTARFNTEYKFNKFVKFGVDMMPRWESWDNTPKLFYAAMAMDPTTPVYRAVEDWVDNPLNNYARSYHNQEWNPVANVARQNAHTDEYGLLMNPYLSIEPVSGLVLRSQFGLNGRFTIEDNFTPEFFIDNLEQNKVSKAERKTNGYIDWSWTNTASYMKTFNEKHNLNVMGGFTMEKFGIYRLEGSREDIPNNHPDLQYINAGTINPQAKGTNEFVSLISYIGRVMYNYDNRYYLTASVRVDGSSKFPDGNKYATFPAVSVAWRIGNESFMKNQSLFTDMKLRAGWGRVGNQEINSNAYLNLIDASDYVFGNGNRYVGTAVSLVGNSKLKWEIVEDYSVGIDFSMLEGRLSVTADVFTKKSKDMLMEKENLLILGYPMWNGRMWTNIGSLKASGWEFTANWRDRAGSLDYEIGVNLSAFTNKAEKLADGVPVITKKFGEGYAIRTEEGGKISRFYGYVTDGVFQNWTEVYNYTDDKGNRLQPDAVPGDLRFKDVNKDGEINEKDKKYIGNPYPKLAMGLNMRFGYKGFDLIANFYGTFGNDIYNSAKAGFYSGNHGQNVYADAWSKAWKGEGTSNSYPRLSVADKNKNYSTVSSFFVEDGSYFRCKVLQLGYTLPKQLFGKIGLRIHMSAQNLFTITNYSGMDPERASMGNALEAGYDEIAYPNPRTYLFGINLTF